MNDPTLAATDLIAWNDVSAQHWHRFATAHPDLLDLPCDIPESGTAAHLLQHVVAVELRYAQRLASQPETEYSDIPCGTADELFATHDHALALIRPMLADPAFDWNQELAFTTISRGRLRASRHVILVHTLMHSIRHYAQLATLARQHGLRPDWPMDFLFLSATPA